MEIIFSKNWKMILGLWITFFGLQSFATVRFESLTFTRTTSWTCEDTYGYADCDNPGAMTEACDYAKQDAWDDVLAECVQRGFSQGACSKGGSCRLFSRYSSWNSARCSMKCFIYAN